MAGSQPNGRNSRIFFASFMTIFAAGVGFAVRGAILGDWAVQYGFTKAELGAITGGGLSGFGAVIILSSLFLDKVGYKPILLLAFLLHLLSAVITLAATPVYASMGQGATYACLFWGMFLFSIGNGLCEGAVNPLVATLYPKQKTHYLNILHASWPAGLIAGSLLAMGFIGEEAWITRLRWEIPMGMFVVPVLIYGLIFLVEKVPQSEVSAAGVSFGEMLMQFASPILLLLLLLHAMVGYVELGTDSWIINIMANVVQDKAIILLMYTSAFMFVLRFCAGPIVERINPLGLLTISATLGFIGLNLLSWADTVVYAFAAATVYALGKTFLWPTMLGVAGERFPKGGALVMGTMGGIGMLSAGMIGAPMIGYQQDMFAQRHLAREAEATYQRYAAAKPDSFYGLLPPVQGLDGEKVGVLNDEGKELARSLALVEKENRTDKVAQTVKGLSVWWGTARNSAPQDKQLVDAAELYGGRMALQMTSYIPLTMAVLYFLLVLYFRMTGGYKQVEIHHQAEGAMSEL